MDLNTAYGAFVDAVIANPTLGPSEAAQAIIDPYAPTLSEADVLTFYGAVAVGYNAIGVLNGTSLLDLRDEIVTEGAVVSKRLFSAVEHHVHNFPETLPVRNEIRRETLTQQLASIPGYETAIESGKNGDPVLDTALDGALGVLEAERNAFESELAALPPYP